MREIKFRVWDTSVKKMKSVYMGSSCIIDAVNDGKPDHGTDTEPIDRVFEFKDSVYKIMQFTGLKDKHGKTEVWESDICYGWQYSFSKNEKRHIGTIVWIDSEGGFTFKVANTTPQEYISLFAIRLEVIGNIYENPKLLE